MTVKSLCNPFHTLIITDASVKNNIATFISHIHIRDEPITKTLHYAVNIMSTKAELFTIRYSVNQATNSAGISKIIVVIDSIHVARKIFDMSSYLFQIYMAAILRELYLFFSYSQDNLIGFWECLSRCNWSLHKVVSKETKSFNPIYLFPCKLSWDYSKKNECNDLTNRWKMIFQVLDTKGWISSTVMTTSSNRYTSKVVHGSDILVTLTLCIKMTESGLSFLFHFFIFIFIFIYFSSFLFL